MAKVSLRAYNREIETMIDRGQLDEAVSHCHHILKTYPKHLETYRLLGKAYLEYKRYGDAVDIFQRILASVPNDFVAQVGMSIIRDEENKLDDAIWHMERAFETQPSNVAIQSELQRLYGRRDGVQPPRIRMTRGALAHMYVRGELYPQAISEIKNVLKEDAGRFDMQALLARACYKSGLKNEAADVASALLRRYPYSLDANRVLVEILGADRPENAQVYRQHVIELDPYAAQVAGNIFQSNEVSDAAVNIERLDWNGQPVGMQSDWGETKAIGLESGTQREEQPDWLKGQSNEMTVPPASQPTSASIFETPTPPQQIPAQSSDDIPDFMRQAGWAQSSGAVDESKPILGEEESAPVQSIEQGDLPDWVKAMKPAEPAQQEPSEEVLPDWINKIGAGALSTQAGDQSDWMNQLEQPAQPSVPISDEQPDWMNQLEQPAQPSAPISDEQPDWLKGLESEPEATPSTTPAGELDWMNQLGEPAQPSAPISDEQPDWMNQLGEPAQPSVPISDEQSDWLKGLESEPEATPPAAQSDELDWLKSVGNEPEATPSTTAAGELDWLKSLEAEPEATPPAAQADELDWLKGLGEAETTPSAAETNESDWLKGSTNETISESVSPTAQTDQPDWLREFSAEAEPATSTPPASTDFDFHDQLTEEPVLQTSPEGTPSSSDADNLGVSEQERDDSFAWLESLAVKQGANEGLLTKPEERLEEEPEWIKQAKGLNAVQTPLSAEPPVTTPATNPEELGKSEQERDDSFAWLENLAAKQGASEGLLTKPEDRLEQEPEWVRQAKDSGTQQPAATSTPPAANLEELGKSEQERDDSFAWLENLAAKQGASEGFLTKPEERLEQEPDWVRQAKDLGAQQPAVSVTPEAEPEQPISMDDTAAWLQSLDEGEKLKEPVSANDETAVWLKSLDEEEKLNEPVSANDETAVWLKSLDEGEKLNEPVSANDETAMWLKSLDEEESKPVQPLESADVDMPAWMKNIEEEAAPVAESTAPAKEAEEESDWTHPTEEPALFAESKSEETDIPSWLNELDKEEQVSAPVGEDDLPAWLRGEEAAPEKPEPTLATDWKPAKEIQPEPAFESPVEEERPEIIYSPPLQETTQPATEMPLPPVSFEISEEEKPVEVQQEETKPEPEPVKQITRKPTPAPQPYKEPVTRRAAGIMMPGADPMLGLARNELSGNNVPGALESYGKLIRKGRFLDEVIHDLREALYQYPLDVSIWQSLGDAYMRANRLQDALDAYTKAEELLR